MPQLIMHIVAAARGNQSGKHLANHTGSLNPEQLQRVYIECNGSGYRLYQARQIRHLHAEDFSYTFHPV